MGIERNEMEMPRVDNFDIDCNGYVMEMLINFYVYAWSANLGGLETILDGSKCQVVRA
jgi:hypothetical protein